MQNTLVEERVVKIASLNGIDVFKVNTERFKTNTINVFFYDNLSRETAAKNALLPAVLRRGCERFPTFGDIALYLEELYGAGFDCGVSKKGERQIIQFYMDYIADRYTEEKSGLFEKTFELLYEIITKPVLKNGTFLDEYLGQEKENLTKLIEGRINDKVQYAVERCFEEMCKEEPFGIHEYGSVEELGKIDNKSLSEHYRIFLEELPMSVFISGNIEDDKINWMIDKLSKLKRGSVKKVETVITDKDIKTVNHITEKMNVNQGKLSLGFRTHIQPNDKEYYSLLVYNGILGGGMHSKLFQNVREKESLAYYAFSRLERFKGLMMISSGIEIENKDKAVDVILKQTEEIRSGNISDYEYESTLKTIETGMKSLKDSQLQVVDFYLSQAITGSNDTFESIIENVKKVRKQDVIDVSKKVELDTVYFLTASNV